MSVTADPGPEHVGVGRMFGMMDAMAERLQAGGQILAADFAGTTEASGYEYRYSPPDVT